jgi:hypothetical protein
MKQIFKFTLTFLLFVALFLACDSKKTEPAAPKMDEMALEATAKAATVTLKDTISNAQFAAWTTTWHNNQKQWMAQVNHSIDYFGMPLVDLTEVLNQKGIVSSRFYLGIKPADSLHLLVVGVDAQGNNMLDNSKGQYAYDVSVPCPSACGSIAAAKK